MATTKIQQGAIADDAITSATLGDDVTLSGDYVKVPVGNTANRPSGASAGYIRFNTTEGTLEQYDGSAWSQMPKPPIISTLSYPGSVTAVSPDGGDVITISGSNFETGVNVYFRSSTYTATYATSVTRTNSTSLSVTTPALTAGDYDVIVENNDGSHAILTSGLTSNAAPSFSTASGSLGSINNDVAMTKITIVASEADSGDIVYTVTTGSLPTGLSLDSSADSAGTISGTPTGYSSETTVNFTITATDDENQTTTRNFSLTVLIDFYNYEISQSLRFNDDDSAYLSWTPSSAGNRTTWTWSGWIKRSAIDNNAKQFFGAGTTATNTSIFEFGKSAEGHHNIQCVDYTSGERLRLRTNGLYRDIGAWYHIVCAWDTTQSTASNRFKLYVNGEQITGFSQNTYPSQNYEGLINSTIEHTIGKWESDRYMDGYMSEVHFVDGTALAATNFGESKEGVWIPKAYSGSYGTNGFYLDFSNSSTLGEDQSGNGNDFSSSGLAAADIVLDTPTNNFATLNPIQKTDGNTAIEFFEGNLKANNTNASLWAGTYSTFAVSSGKWYWEWKQVEGDSTGDFQSGIQIFDGSSTVDWDAVSPQAFQGSIMYYGDNGQKRINNSLTNYGSSYGNGDIIGVALDLDSATQTVTFYKNGTSQGAINLSLSTSQVVTVTPAFAFYIDAFVANFGQDSTFAGTETAQNNSDGNGYGDFYYEPPTGYLALCTLNLPDNTFDLNVGEKPSEYFNTVLYTGTGATQSITGVGFQPDLVWVKNTDGASDDNQLYDVVRGAGKLLKTNDTVVEATVTGGITSFNSDGFTTGASGATNNSGDSIVAWCWKAGGTASSNTDGDITSSVSANTTAGFSIVSYTGNATSGQTVGHGLNSAPEFIIWKNRTDGLRGWPTYHKNTSTYAYDYTILLNGTSARDNRGAQFLNSTSPSASLITLGNWEENNGSSDDIIAYCWHGVEGFSKFGAYIGNGSVDGPFIPTGFRPGWVMIRSIGSGNWMILDNVRDTSNPLGERIKANATDAGSIDVYQDHLSNGFKIRTTASSWNTDGTQYIYAAFAEDPFKYDNAR